MPVSAVTPSVPASTLLTIAQGTLRGARRNGVHVFRGIPYAAPLTGAARFAPPGPPRQWDGVRDATVPGPTAPVPPPGSRVGGIDLEAVTGPGWIPGEEYLTVDVWTPDPGAAGLPVMLFVHGGGFISGTGSAPLYDGTAFARDDVVLVTCNYRLGVPGWLHLPDAPANRGLLDVSQALRWVRDNAIAFGGDPGNITVFGQSAGATLTASLLAVPCAAGLMRRAIVQSGTGTGSFTPEQATRVTRALAGELGVPATARAFAEVPDEDFVRAVPRMTGLDLTTDRPDPLLGLSPFAPVLDPATLVDQPADAVACGVGAGVDLLIGTNTDEAALYLAPTGALAATTEDDLRTLAGRVAPGRTDSVLAAYRAVRPGVSAGALRTALMSDHLFTLGSRKMARAHATASGARTFLYEFAWRSPSYGGTLGACHLVELPFVFDRLDLPSLYGPDGLLGPAHAPRHLARQVHRTWVRFARTGDPGLSRADGPLRIRRLDPATVDTARVHGPCSPDTH